MRVKKFRRGDYIVTLHNFSFTLAKLSEEKNWTLYNHSNNEVTQFETKKGAIELMKQWSPEQAKRQATI